MEIISINPSDPTMYASLENLLRLTKESEESFGCVRRDTDLEDPRVMKTVLASKGGQDPISTIDHSRLTCTNYRVRWEEMGVHMKLNRIVEYVTRMTHEMIIPPSRALELRQVLISSIEILEIIYNVRSGMITEIRNLGINKVPSGEIEITIARPRPKIIRVTHLAKPISLPPSPSPEVTIRINLRP